MNSSDKVLITVRIIKSFEYRTCRNMVIPVDIKTSTIDQLKQQCQELINSDSKFKPFRTVKFDTLKIYTQAFGNKTQNLIINLEDAGFLEDGDAILQDVGVISETELSLFNREAYDAFKKNPEIKW
ncbi:hypothetical protein GGH12_003645 [Coemansia sp. RSA 1822]|nr:hypothetical protein LPJ76_003941 [Coemansia sp. RSA 638]KAJ2124446.1 hypothetical protein IW147_001812 [Coemansia sp. RSA 720]KAJ2541752.1 hypothetical protein GGF49_003398 [Coemansia sp. RSA 1853]KAJ2561849.1 hypothetical protein GGH12_003645 [Coemansia sp. RSA 1822]